MACKKTHNSPPGGRILVVDDNRDFLEGLESTLKDSYEVHLATGVKEAYPILKDEQIDLVVLDVYLGDGDGLELIESIKALKNIPVLVITGFGTKEVAVRALRARADDYLDKPFDITEFKERVDNLVRTSQLEGQEVERAKGYIEKNYYKKISSQDIARAVNMGERNLRDRFKNRFGCTHSQYLRRVRIREAKKLLETPEMSIKEVAKRVGIDDPKYLSKVLKRIYGLPPKAFRD